MTDKDEQHIKLIAAQFGYDMAIKYEKGVKEHGGHLPDKPGLFREVKNEAIDQMVYIFTLRDQLENVLSMMVEAHSEKSLELYAQATCKLEDILV
jgi:hypothetical protein